MGLDLFLSGAKSQLQSLMSTQSSPPTINTAPSAVSSSLGHTQVPVEDGGNKSAVTSSSVADTGDDFGSSFGPSTTANTSDDNAFTPSTNFDDFGFEN